MPDTYCEVLQVLRHCIHLMVFLLWMVVALLKFWIVCVRKTVPTMDDNFVTTFITMASFMLALLFSLAGVMLPQKPALAHVSLSFLSFLRCIHDFLKLQVDMQWTIWTFGTWRQKIVSCLFHYRWIESDLQFNLCYFCVYPKTKNGKIRLISIGSQSSPAK